MWPFKNKNEVSEHFQEILSEKGRGVLQQQTKKSLVQKLHPVKILINGKETKAGVKVKLHDIPDIDLDAIINKAFEF